MSTQRVPRSVTKFLAQLVKFAILELQRAHGAIARPTTLVLEERAHQLLRSAKEATSAQLALLTSGSSQRLAATTLRLSETLRPSALLAHTARLALRDLVLALSATTAQLERKTIETPLVLVELMGRRFPSLQQAIALLALQVTTASLGSLSLNCALRVLTALEELTLPTPLQV